MAHYRARQDFKMPGQKRGEVIRVQKGQIVDVINRHVADRLLSEGKIGRRKHSAFAGFESGEPAPFHAITKRVGIWMRTSTSYSGGRLHMYQYALAMAKNGAEVWLITNRHPKWRKDYHNSERLHISLVGEDKIPPDLDLIITDCKADYGRKAQDWAEDQPNCKLVTMNFETPNWVRKYCEHYANNLDKEQWRDVFRSADLQLANSKPSLNHCLSWIGQPDKLARVLPPVLNDKALYSDYEEPKKPERPYAMWSARSASYKGSQVAQESIWDLDSPFDIVCLGRPTTDIENTDKHQFHHFPDASDAAKYDLMGDAELVLAPSLFEGFGMVPMEAMSVGTPVVCYDLPVLRWAYGDRPVYAEWDNPEDYKQKVKETLDQGVPDKTVRWIRSTYGEDAMQERVDNLPYHTMSGQSVSVQMLAWGYEDIIPYALDSVYDHVDQIIVAIGPTSEAFNIWPGENTRQAVESYPDPDGKIEVEAREIWESKLEMRNWTANQVKGNYMLMLDADEIWVGLEEFLNSDIEFGCPRWVNLWHGPDHWIYDPRDLNGTRWGKRIDPYGSVCPHYRFSRWRQTYRFRTHPFPIDFAGGRLAHTHENKKAAEAVPEATIYHLGHSLSAQQMEYKHKYYEKRDNAPSERRDSWHNWDGQTGRMEDGIVSEVDWELPDIVKEACNE